MNTKTLSDKSLSVIDQYLHFSFGSAVCSVPYFNNKTVRARGALRPIIGKGSSKEITDELQTLTVKEHIAADTLNDESLKKILVDNNLGIECSGFTYYVLNAENNERGHGNLSVKISFPYCTGIVGKIRCSLRPIENCDVATFAHDNNSKVISLSEVQPGDFITMTGGQEEAGIARGDRDHILVIHLIEFQNSIPIKLHYSHAVAYPEDGIFGNGIKQGIIKITDISKPITNQIWSEENREGASNRLFLRANESKTELRRLRWF